MAAHAHGQGAGAIELTELDRAEFFHDIGYAPHVGQWPMHLSTARYRLMACGVRWGKTTAAAHEALALALEPKPRAVGWVVASTYDLAEKVWREVVHELRTKLPEMIVEHREHEHLLRVLNMDGGVCEIRRKSADSPVSLLGEGLDWLVLDEAAQVKPDIWERYLLARLLDKRGRAVLISTPKGKGWFYDAYRKGQRGDSDWASWNSPTQTNPIIRVEDLERLRAGMPEAVYRQEYEAAFIEGAGQVFRNVRELATCEWAEPVAGEEYCAGLDLAKVADYTVLVVMDSKRRVVHLDRFNRIDWAQQIQRIAATCQRYNDAWTVVDSTGAGEPVYEALLEAGIRADGYSFTQASKAALVNNLAMMLERGLVTLPRPELAPELVDELEAFEFTVTDAGNVKTGAPPGMHDDCAVACMLAAWAAKDAGEWEVQFV